MTRALLLALFLACTAAAQDVAPVISWIELNGARVTQAPAGSVVTIVGRGFPATDPDGRHPAGLAVTLDGRQAHLLWAQESAVTFLVPEAERPGPAQLRVSVAGGETAATDLMLRRPYGTGSGCFRDLVYPASWLLDEGVVTEHPNPALADAVEASVRVTRFELVVAADTFEVEGRCGDVPDGLRVVVSLHRADRQHTTTTVTLRDGRWGASFGPHPGVAAGRYEVRALFDLGAQTASPARAFRERHPAARQGLYDRVECYASFDVGTAAEAGRVELARQAYIAATCEEAARLFDALDRCWAEVEPLDRAPEPTDGNAWRRFVEAELFPAVRAAARLHAEARASLPWPLREQPEPAADLLAILLGAVQARTRTLHAKLGTPPPRQLVDRASLHEGSSVQPSTLRTRASFDELRAECLRDVGGAPR